MDTKNQIKNKEKEIRLILKGKDVETFNLVKSWLNKNTDTSVLRTLITDKFQEIKKLRHLGRISNSKEKDPLEKIMEGSS